ncbi:MAG: DNA topoisomerase 3 [Methylococcales bacterium]|nr:DNA topoisomerase 3 [Methylococcales bacterium]
MDLYLCEKPSQGRDLAKALGIRGNQPGYIGNQQTVVTWCIGHLLELYTPDDYNSQWKKWTLEQLPIFPTQWKYNIKANTRKQFTVVKKLINKAQCVYISSDGDREGETLAREILDKCHYKGETKRLWLTALDNRSIKKALSQIKPGQQTESLYWSGLGRMRADWLMGMNLTRLFSVSHQCKRPLTVGRVQTPTLKLVVDRDLEIENFVAQNYFDLFAEFKVENGCFKAKWQVPKSIADDKGRCLKKTEAETVRIAIENKTGHICQCKTQRKKQKPPWLYSLSTLQQYASRRYGFSADKTLKLAQSLYEKHKAISYPRTDCNYLPIEQFSEVSSVFNAITQSDPSIQQIVAQASTAKRPSCFNTSKVTAHHAIIPTASQVNINQFNADEFKLYQEVRRRYIAQFYPDYEYDESIIEVDIEKHLFKVTGRIPRIQGWKAVANEESRKNNKAENILLPPVKLNEPAHVIKSDLVSLQTKPPERLTEGTLIAAMKSIAKYVTSAELKKILKENAGIGTESTRAAIIKNLLDREFIKKENKYLISTETGRYLISILPESIKNPATTALWEQKLDEIEKRTYSLEQFIEEQQRFIESIINDIKNNPIQSKAPVASFKTPRPNKIAKRKIPTKIKEVPPQPKDSHDCPKCQQKLVQRKGKNGVFWGCSNYPKCRFTMDNKINNPVIKKHSKKLKTATVKTNIDDNQICPKCNKKMVKRKSKYGEFWGCSGFPECKTIVKNKV